MLAPLQGTKIVNSAPGMSVCVSQDISVLFLQRHQHLVLAGHQRPFFVPQLCKSRFFSTDVIKTSKVALFEQAFLKSL